MVFDLQLEEQFQPHRGLCTGRPHACSMLITMEGKKQGDGDQGVFHNRLSDPLVLKHMRVRMCYSNVICLDTVDHSHLDPTRQT